MSGAASYSALVLAANRPGRADPVASTSGKTHKGFAHVDGSPMLLRVLQALEASVSVQRIFVAIEDAAAVRDEPALASCLASGVFAPIESAASPVRTVLAALDAIPDALPLLVATGDHPLLTAEMIDHFCANAAEPGDVAVALTRAELVSAAYPDSVRTRLRFQDGARCGCNLFALNTPAARKAAVFWQSVEAARKSPWRLVGALGPGPLLSYWRRRLSLDAALRLASQRIGVSIRPVNMPYPEAAIDVDKPDDLALVESIIRNRAEGHGQAA